MSIFVEVTSEHTVRDLEKMGVEVKTVFTKKRVDELLSDQKFLNQLRAAGVDNWEGFPGIEDDEDEDTDIKGEA